MAADRAGWPRLLFFTDPRVSDDAIVAAARDAAGAIGGALGVVVRELGDRTAAVARRLAIETPAAVVFVKRDVALARAVGARGLHLGSPPGPPGLPRDLLVLGSAHTAADAALAEARGLGGVVVSPVFATPGKGPARGPEALTEARALAPSCVVFALGGVDADRAPACAAAGAHGAAVVRALADAARPGEAARAIALPFRADWPRAPAPSS
ncbi:MAG: thiamine phosphate synthase [Myxococcales bacterium]|nr:thiamine phosphate synthase [Myxococcales bacterium]